MDDKKSRYWDPVKSAAEQQSEPLETTQNLPPIQRNQSHGQEDTKAIQEQSKVPGNQADRGDAYPEAQGQIRKRVTFDEIPNLHLFQLTWCSRYDELKEQAVQDAAPIIERWANSREYDTPFAQAFLLTQGALSSHRGEILVIASAEFRPVHVPTHVYIHLKTDRRPLRSMTWPQASFVLEENECLRLVEGQIEIILIRIWLKGCRPAILREPERVAERTTVAADTAATVDPAKTVDGSA